ncbi:MAG TPA: DegT/DnrJ/EryC1/StrS family aminotransferase [Actinomycetota bacterium]|nr:DegT/DnrJ/EryC1/StrS family aminotransferase [Actinomycetota bacterium]
MAEQRLIEAAPNVPFLDLGMLHRDLKAEIVEEIAELVDSSAFTNGPQVREFEAAFAAYCGTEHCVGLASGLDALRLGLQAAGLEAGDEVVVAASTFVATLEAVTQAGGRPVVVDATNEDYNLDPGAVEAALTERTRFLMPTHLYGQLADMRSLTEIAERRGLAILEDACQAHGASRDGIAAGTAGLANAFSFYPGKNLGAFGDAGALVTDDEELAARVRALREHGQTRKYVHEIEGWTARLDTIQAIVLRRKLPLLDRWNGERRAVAAKYDERLAGIGDLRLPPVPDGSEPVWHIYAIRTAAPEELAGFLRERGIGTGRHYPDPVHLAPAYSFLGHERGEFPVAEALASEVLSLPMFPGMTEQQVDTVVAAIADYFA